MSTNTQPTATPAPVVTSYQVAVLVIVDVKQQQWAERAVQALLSWINRQPEFGGTITIEVVPADVGETTAASLAMSIRRSLAESIDTPRILMAVAADASAETARDLANALMADPLLRAANCTVGVCSLANPSEPVSDQNFRELRNDGSSDDLASVLASFIREEVPILLASEHPANLRDLLNAEGGRKGSTPNFLTPAVDDDWREARVTSGLEAEAESLTPLGLSDDDTDDSAIPDGGRRLGRSARDRFRRIKTGNRDARSAEPSVNEPLAPPKPMIEGRVLLVVPKWGFGQPSRAQQQGLDWVRPFLEDLFSQAPLASVELRVEVLDATGRLERKRSPNLEFVPLRIRAGIDPNNLAHLLHIAGDNIDPSTGDSHLLCILSPDTPWALDEVVSEYEELATFTKIVWLVSDHTSGLMPKALLEHGSRLVPCGSNFGRETASAIADEVLIFLRQLAGLKGSARL